MYSFISVVTDSGFGVSKATNFFDKTLIKVLFPALDIPVNIILRDVVEEISSKERFLGDNSSIKQPL